MKYIIKTLFNNGDVKLENVPRWWESKADIWVPMTISLLYYRFIVRFTIRLAFLFIVFLLQFFLAQMSFLSICSYATYSSTFYSHIYLSIDIISVYMKAAMHQVHWCLLLSWMLCPVRQAVVYLPSCCMLMT